jgi:hypothetical protein
MSAEASELICCGAMPSPAMNIWLAASSRSTLAIIRWLERRERRRAKAKHTREGVEVAMTAPDAAPPQTASLFDHGESECFGGLEVDGKLELGKGRSAAFST